MELFKLRGHGRDTRLITHNNTVYKVKLVYTKTEESEHSLPCDVKSMQSEIGDAIRVVLSGTQSPLKTDHFIIHTVRKQWKMASLLIFTKDGKRLGTHASMLTLFLQAREDVGNQATEHQQQSPKAESKRQKQRDRRMAHRSSPLSPAGSRKHTRSFAVKETSLPSPPLPKKLRPPDTRNSADQVQRQQGVGHRQYLLRRTVAATVANKEQRGTTSKYHLRSQEFPPTAIDLEAASLAKDHQDSDRSRRRPRRHSGGSAGREAREDRQGPQGYVRDMSQPREAEPRVGATATADSRPAYPQGGVVQHDVQVCHQPGRHGREQYQLDEQMRLQRLAGNQQTHPPAVAQYQLRPRGPFQRMMNAVLTPVKNLFT